MALMSAPSIECQQALEKPMTTRHTHGANFGRRVAGCPRCDELKAGAPPVQWNWTRAKAIDAEFQRACAAHFAPGGPHATGRCGPVCTFGEY
jgi:hypothetical protein